MLRIVELQCQLVRSLCALPEGAVVDLPWLQRLAWPAVDSDWVCRFWGNQNGRRQPWMNTVASADRAAKDELLRIMGEQHRFRELYTAPVGVHLTQTDAAFWEGAHARRAMKNLLLDFYEPWLRQDLGYPDSVCQGNGHLTRQAFLREPVFSICPYCDNQLQSTELDHFLPKSAFPFLSVHPDNLIPSCHDSNRGDRKGDTPPLDWTSLDQTAEHFHPRWRSAVGKFKVAFIEQGARELVATLEALDPADQPKVANLDRLFRLAEFWGRTLMCDIQDIQKEIANDMWHAGGPADAAAARACLTSRSENCQRCLNRRPLQYYWQHLYAHAAQSDLIIREVLRQYHEDRQIG
ncbi:MAG: hypothetical protein ABFD92_07945 [Planctomycetaceae bacterium]|nr:hypothetical protein [Planctomycetaceae bacterium]